jgi:NDP-sugar pyrophosphorylase family protein
LRSETAEAVILAGGRAERLLPATREIPKCLLPIGGVSTLDLLLAALDVQGFEGVTISLGHLAEEVEDHLAERSVARFAASGSPGLRVRTVVEERPLSTAGPLKQVEAALGPILSVNGDLLTDLDFRALLHFHRCSGAIATLGVQRRRRTRDFGVVEADGSVFRAFHEKPSEETLESLGVNAIEPAALAHVEKGEPLDMPTFLNRLYERGERVAVYEATCHWLDIGRPTGFARAPRFVAEHLGHLTAP